MKRLIVGLCLLLSGPLLVAQNIHGRIVDAVTGQPISQATIELEGRGSVTANMAGSFTVPIKFFKNTRIIISSVGYKTIKTTLTEEENQEYRLERYNLMMAPVEVRATRAADNAPFTKTNIS